MTRTPCRNSIRTALPVLRLGGLLLAALAGLAGPSLADPARPLTITAQTSADGSRLGLSWDTKGGAAPQIFRRNLGQSGIESWTPYRPQIAQSQRLLDVGLQPGQAYEYQIRLEAGKNTYFGYWTTGREVPIAPLSGHAILVVDDTLAGTLADRLDRLRMDLLGDGWSVTRIDAPRGGRDDAETMARAITLRQQIGDVLNAHPGAASVLLIGHLPVVKSGWVAPDGHDRQPQATDLFYVTPNGFWRPARTPDGKLALQPTLIPGGHIAAPVGRVDFSGLAPEFGDEADLLAAWLDRNHRWRRAETPVPQHGYSGSGHVELEKRGLANILGPKAVIEAGHHSHQGKGPFLFGVDFGSHRGMDYAEKPPVEAVFTINFGSGKQQFAADNNPMRALVAASDMALTSAWGGRPSWLLHGMALNETIGQAQMRTANNGDVTKGGMETREYGLTGNYDWINPVWVNLIGDPTLRPFPQRPAEAFSAKREGGAVRLIWRLPEDAQSAILYRADGRDGPYSVIAEDLTGGDFTDEAAPDKAWYMLRAKGLAQVYAGSVFRLSDGVFAAVP